MYCTIFGTVMEEYFGIYQGEDSAYPILIRRKFGGDEVDSTGNSSGIT